MAHNQAVVVLEPHKAGIRDVPYPTLPAEDYMIVRTTAVAINPTDWKHIEFENEWSSEGCQVGFDYAGVVEHVGSEVVKPFKKGDRVAGCAHGT
jgi:NADPH:quinone reductase-like Zn-dependent oxidoreductase